MIIPHGPVFFPLAAPNTKTIPVHRASETPSRSSADGSRSIKPDITKPDIVPSEGFWVYNHDDKWLLYYQDGVLFYTRPMTPELLALKGKK